MSSETVKVIVRCRPLNEREIRLNCDVVVTMDTSIVQVQLQKPKTKQAPPKLFTFDGVYYMEDTTQKIYEDICFPLVANVLEGYNGTVFAYGQTGCGKSYTMVGVEDTNEQLGVIPRSFDHIFDHISVTEGTKFLVQASYLEIYNEEVRDLLGKDVKRKLDLKEHPDRGVYVSGLSMHKVHNRQELEKVMAMGSKNRSMGATLMNVDSSRSHCIFTIDIEMFSVDEDGEEKLRAGKMNLVDLAGSERQSKTGATGDRLKEATKINLSLSALGNVISALVDGKAKHIPYRDSKLTRLLQSSLGGNTKTLMVACISPADNNYDETLSTLRYANRAKNIKNKPRINEDPKDALLREYQEEIKKLKMMLMGQMDIPDSLSTVISPSQRDSNRDYESEIAALKEEYEGKLSTLQEQYGTEHANRTKLEEDMSRLKSHYENQLAEAKEKHISDGNDQTLVSTQDQRGIILSGEEGVILTDPNGVTVDDKQILWEHETAIQKLTSLQEGLIGGEKAADISLKQKMEERKQYAEDRLTQLKHANASLDDDDDGILERIFNNLTDEVRVKTRALERVQLKCKSAEEDIKDLQSEFELERQDFLETIRKQDRELQLQRQLLDTMVPLLRRDCNYYNLDKVRSECKFDEETSEWILPKVSHSTSSLVPVTSSVSITTHSSSHTRLPKRNSNVGRPNSPSGTRGIDEDKFASKWQSKGNNTDYFTPKRAQEILAECSTVKGTPQLERSHKPITGSVSVGAIKSPSHQDQNGGSTCSILYGVETQFFHISDSVGKPRKLNAIPNLPGPHSPVLPPQTSSIEMADKMIQMKRKPKQLEPLQDHGRKQFY